MLLKISCKTFLLFCLCCITILSAKAQVTITGKITDAVTGKPLSGAYIVGKSGRSIVYTDSSGHYKITVKKERTVKYHYVGYFIEEFDIPKRLTHIVHDVKLLPKRSRLKMVEVKGYSKYTLDSLDRIKDFNTFLQRSNPNFLDTHTPPEHGAGFVFHPFTYFSKDARRKRQFRKRYKQHEKEAYIDSRYSPKTVSKVTGLTGDSLKIFMLKYRPPYKFTRHAEELVFKSWILKHYKKWIKR